MVMASCHHQCWPGKQISWLVFSLFSRWLLALATAFSSMFECCLDWMFELNVWIECSSWMFGLTVRIECLDWMFELNVWIECSNWMFALNVWIECSNWMFRLNVWIEQSNVKWNLRTECWMSELSVGIEWTLVWSGCPNVVSGFWMADLIV